MAAVPRRYLVVLQRCKPVGIMTERNFVDEIAAKGKTHSKIKVSEVKSSPLVTVDPDKDLLESVKIMREKGVRKLLVIRNDILCGIITERNNGYKPQ